MRFHFQIGPCDVSHYIPLAQAAEEAGFDGATLPDSLCYPKIGTSLYPYNGDGSRDFLENEPFAETLIAITAMATATKRIRFASFVYKLAVRQIVGVAKQVQTIQEMCGGRLDFGVGLSPWDEDFHAMQTPTDARGVRLDEQLQIFRGLESGEYFGFDGKAHQLPEIRTCPVPKTPTTLLIGGHSKPALRRAAAYDGWMCAGVDTPQLEIYINQINALRDELGVAHKPYSIYTGSADGFSTEGIENLASLGVTDLVIGFRDLYAKQPDLPLETKVELLQGYASEFIS